MPSDARNELLEKRIKEAIPFVETAKAYDCECNGDDQAVCVPCQKYDAWLAAVKEEG